MSARHLTPPVGAVLPRTWPLSTAMPPIAALRTVPGVARAFVRSTLPAWHMESLIEGAELVASELASNAVAASTDGYGHPVYFSQRMPIIRVCLLTDGVRVLLEVWDQAPGVPEVQDADGDQESGRGLLLVEAMADKWGWSPANGWPGKVVWAEMSLLPSDRSPTDLRCKPDSGWSMTIVEASQGGQIQSVKVKCRSACCCTFDAASPAHRRESFAMPRILAAAQLFVVPARREIRKV